ncbi:MAG: hypothetical protein ACRD8A_11870 [Candidatus Acidiferrales bacterium]
MKRVATILVLFLATAILWIASSPATLHALAVPGRVASSSTVPALHVSTGAAIPQAPTSASEHTPITAPLALLLQGAVFLACGFLWPKKLENSQGGKGATAAVHDSTACAVETVTAD